MHQQEPFQVSELGHGEVASQDGLHPFHATDAHSNVCRCQNETAPPCEHIGILERNSK